MRVSEFQYDLPRESIAQTAIEPRHDSRLLDTRDMSDHTFRELASLLEPGDLLVVNETKVRAARLIGSRKGTGGTVELLVLEKRLDGRWKALAKPARRLRRGVVIEFDGLVAHVAEESQEGLVVVDLLGEDVEATIERVGQVPLPPYFTGTLDDSSRYQTRFANIPGSAAAPTAGLHFTEAVVADLEERQVQLATVDLHVSLDTFRPISTDEIEDHQMHSEWCSIPEKTAAAIASTSGRVVAVGTTVVRTLESFASRRGVVDAGEKSTDLYITPGFEFKVTDALITNFHLPGSTLLVLLAAFMGGKWRDAYENALHRGYRFLSFGDAMYVERSQT